jgi:threonine synthase
MKPQAFPEEIRDFIIPELKGNFVYRCLECLKEYGIEKLLYTCPDCGNVLMLYDLNFDLLKKIPGKKWQQIFDYRRMAKITALKGIYLYHEFIGPVIPLSSVVYLGEGHTPVVEANSSLKKKAGIGFFFKNDGQNPSASFKDRGMASAFSYINHLINERHVKDVLAVCASTGDTSASAALYGSYLMPHIKSAVLLPHKKVTPQQLAQPLGSGASVFEIPGVFDDCMKIVERLSEKYNVALLNSKNAWRILGQESYSYEIAQDFEYDMNNKAVFVPIGNAGNITAVLNGFMKFYETGIIDVLPKIFGVQSEHASPVFNYYNEPDVGKRRFVPVNVRPSVAQAAMIGNPVSMPRVIHLVDKYNRLAGKEKVFFVEVNEQSIMDWQITANRNGHIACTHGGECLAGLSIALSSGLISSNETAILNSTAHALKFSGFQEMYFENTFPSGYDIIPDKSLINHPVLIKPEGLDKIPAPGKPLSGDDLYIFVKRVSDEIACMLDLKKR